MTWYFSFSNLSDLLLSASTRTAKKNNTSLCWKKITLKRSTEDYLKIIIIFIKGACLFISHWGSYCSPLLLNYIVFTILPPSVKATLRLDICFVLKKYKTLQQKFSSGGFFFFFPQATENKGGIRAANCRCGPNFKNHLFWESIRSLRAEVLF